ncbi:MAG: hypothetical protein UMR38_03775 [Candidatus Izemoplasma sp.]|nr:hypothetical protein [Candidatus Izemoplasma sp.]
MPQGLNYELYFNIAFFGVIGLGFLIGYFRGLKKTLYNLIVLVLFYAFFFITIDAVVDALWVLEMPSVFDMAAPYVPELSGVTTLGNAVFTLVETYAGSYVGDTMSNDVFISFVTGISLFVVKIIYAIVYFTIGQIVFRFIAYVIRVLFFSGSNKEVILDYNGEERTLKGKKDHKKYRKEEKRHRKDMKKMVKQMSRKEKRQHKKDQARLAKDQKKFAKKQKIKKKKPLLGAFAGAAKGTVSAFVGLIMLGGMLNITESFLVLLPEETTQTAQTIETIYLANDYNPYDPLYQNNISPEPMATGLIDIPTNMQSTITETRNMIDGYNNNLFVEYAYKVTYTDENYNAQVPLNLYLFDTVFSFYIEEDKVLLRNELDTMAETANILLSSDYRQTNDISDITGDEVTALFVTLSESKFVTSMIPLGIDIASGYFETPLEIPTEDLYAIDWASELSTLGAVAGTGFDLINTAGIMNDDTDLTTVTLDGTEVKDLFDSLSQSEIATLAAYVALEPLLERQSGQLSAVITVPQGVTWENEYQAFGEVAKAVLDTNITVGQLQAGDPNVLIGALSDMDFTVLLQSEIVSHALKNIFDGTAGIEGLDVIVVPDGVNWFDVYDNDGNLQTAGELRNILEAVNAITNVAEDFDFNNISLDVIANFDDPTIDTIFDSELLVATISDFLLNMDLGTTPLIIPDSVLDANNYLLASELKNVASAATVLVNDLACDEGDTVCEEQGFDIAKAFSLSDTSINTLTTSDILSATIGNIIIDQGGSILTVPNSALTTISVDGVNQDVVSKTEISKLFQAVGVLGFTDLENMTFDASIIQNLGTDADPTILDTTKSNTLFDSKLVHATLSQMLFEQAEGASAILTVPYFTETGGNVIIEDTQDSLNYVAQAELNAMLQSLLTLNITDFTAVDSLDLTEVIADADTLLDSSILHATISKQIFDLGTETIKVPYEDVDTNPIRITVGDTNDSTDTEYITEDEIIAILDALEILGITDFDTFTGSIDLASITSDPNNIITMLDSATLHATISDQLIDQDTAGNISIPHFAEDNSTTIRLLVGPSGNETEFISKDEIEAIIDALNILGLTDVGSFDGAIDLSTIYDPDATTPVDNRSEFLASSTIQATISKQVIDLESTATTAFVVPHFAEDDTTKIRVAVGDPLNNTDTEYITKAELSAVFEGMDLLGITDVTSFNGSINLTTFFDETKRNTLLASSTMQGTISKQLLDLGDGTLRIPSTDIDSVAVKIDVGNAGDNTDFTYVSKTEIGAMFESLEVLNITDINSFTGSINLSNIYDDTNQDVLLNSAAMHATITKQMVDLGDTFLNVPDVDVNNNVIQETVNSTLFIVKDEIKATIEALEVLNISDIGNVDGTFDFTLISNTTNQDILLGSASIHRTITDKVIALDDTDNLVIVPNYTQDGETVGNEIRLTVAPEEYIIKEEIKALIDAFTAMGYSNLDTFGAELNSSEFFAERDTILLSSILQATLSNKLLNTSGGDTLVIPDVNVNTSDTIRIVQTDVTYVNKTEIDAIMDGLEEMGLTDFGALTFDPTTIFAADFNIVLTSASLQATISGKILPTAGDETTPVGTTTLLVPTEFREAIHVNSVGDTHIEKVELIRLLESLEVLGVSDFNGGMNASTITSMSDTDLTTLLISSSVHTTLDNMLRGNANIASDIPALAENTFSYAGTLITRDEIKYFIQATQEVTTDFTSVSFDLSTLNSLDAAGQDTVATSMIVRNIVTPEIVGPYETINGADSYPDTEYMNNDDTTFLTKDGVLNPVTP